MKRLRYKLGVILWGVALIISFIILPFRWTVFSIIYVAAISPIILMFIYAPFRGLLLKSSDTISFVAGFIEAVTLIVVYYLLSMKSGMPTLAVLVVVGMHTANQIARFYRDGDQREFNSLIHYLITIGIWSIAEFLG